MADGPNEQIDFSALDPTHDPARFDRRVAAIVSNAEVLLARRRARAGAMFQLARWQRPVAAAAALILLLAYAVISQLRPAGPDLTGETGFSEAMGMPVQLVQWLGANEPPSPAELLFTVEEN